MIFEIYTKEVELTLRSGNKIKINLRPLSGRFIPKLFRLASKISDAKDNISQIYNDESLMEDLHCIIKETIKKSYPMEASTNEEVIDEFVSQNLLKLIEGVMDVNMGSQAE